MTKTVTWVSAQPSVASIDQSGLALGKLVGSANLTATSGSVTSSVTLTVGAAALVSIAVTPNGLSLPKGETQQLSAVGTFSDGSQKTITESAAWSVAPTGIATISATGLVKGQAVGAAKSPLILIPFAEAIRSPSPPRS